MLMRTSVTINASIGWDLMQLLIFEDVNVP